MTDKKGLFERIQTGVEPIRMIRSQVLATCLLIGLVAEHAACAAGLGAFPLVFPNHALTKTEAATDAGLIAQECSRILNLLPRLSPREDAWLDGEIQSGRDVQGLMQRPEFARRALGLFFTDCISQSQLAAQGASRRDRTLAWARLASRFSSAIDLNYWGTHAGVEGLQEPVGRFAAWSRLNTYLIIDSAVLPYLEDSAAN